MRFTASSFYGLYQPSPCPLRPFLRTKGVKEAPLSPYAEVLIELGKRYEARYLSSLKDVVDLSGGEEAERCKKTIGAINAGARVLYQPVFRAEARFANREVTVVGIPDFMIKEDRGYVIRDVKLSRRINEQDHPEIMLQLGIYGWLFEQTMKAKPQRLEVLAGTGKVEEVPAAFIERAVVEAKRFVEISVADEEPFSPVGWTKCGSCGFSEHCWPRAVDLKTVSIVSGVDQNVAVVLRSRGVRTIDDLLKNYDEASLAELEKPWGKKTQKIGKAAERILRNARAIAANQEQVLKKPEIPPAENYVMFDLEGLPPQMDELDKIYLWGLKVFGAKPSPYMGPIAEVGDKGDMAGWEGFLESANAIFQTHGDIPFVHWHHYERTKINAYIARFGDKDGIAERVKANLVDLLPRAQAAIVLPLSSYSLKVVERYVGYKRSQDEYGGDWSMATFIKATETEDESTRAKLLRAIQTYNEEDLDATWAVFQWLSGKKPN